jgi:phosphate:Na+ symporter
MESSNSFDWMFFGDFLGALALFLFGMKQITEAAKEITPSGDQLRTLIQPFVSNALRAALAGMIVSAVLQSSTIVSILCIQFVNSAQIQSHEALAMLIGVKAKFSNIK